MAAVTAKTKVGKITRIWPQALQVFARHRLELRCRGVHPLALVASKHGFDLEKVLDELNVAIAAPAPASKQERPLRRSLRPDRSLIFGEEFDE